MNVDYENSLVNLSNSILKRFGVPTLHSTIDELDKILIEDNAKNVVLILCDGMGSKILEENLDETSFLRKNKFCDISSVYPPTTAAATTSLLSGLYPCEHGWLGWNQYIKPIDKTITMFLNTIKDTDIPAMNYSIKEKFFSYTSIIDRINSVSNAELIYPFNFEREFALDKMLSMTKKYCSKSGKKFIYVYYDEPDYTTHIYGYEDKKVANVYKKIDKKLESFCNNIEDTTVIIVADHGHITCESILLSDYDDLYSTLDRDISIEGRGCAFFIKDGMKDKFVNLFNKYFSKDFILLTKQEVLDKNVFGYGNYHKEFISSLGDYLAIAKTNKYFRYSDKSINLKFMHGGSTDYETIIPLIISRKKEL